MLIIEALNVLIAKGLLLKTNALTKPILKVDLGDKIQVPRNSNFEAKRLTFKEVTGIVIDTGNYDINC